MDTESGLRNSDPRGSQVPRLQPHVEVLDVTPGAARGDTVGYPTYTRLGEACAAEYPRLVRLLTVYCGDRDIACDLAQETLARGCAHWQRVRRMGDQRAWFTRVALNLANSRWRRLTVERRAMARFAALSTTGEPGTDHLAEALAVRTALADLTARQRAAVVLRYFDDLDLATTAAVMRCSQSTVKKLTARGIASLKTRLQFDGPAQEARDD